MGVMLSLDRQRPARGRRRQGQHERHAGDQARAQMLADVRRYDPPSGRLLTRLARAVLARRGPVIAGPGAAAAPRDSAADGSAPAA